METTSSEMNRSTIPRHEFFRLVGTGIGAILLTRCLSGCTSEAAGKAIDANQKLDFTIRLNDKFNQNLMQTGGYIFVNNIIIARAKDGQFLAVSSACTHQEGVKLIYKAAENQFYCPLHLARFDVNGNVVAGPATQPLTRYSVEPNLAGGVLRVRG